MAKPKKNKSLAKVLLLLLLGLFGFGIVIALFLQGNNVAILNSKGAIASQQRDLILFSVILLLVITVPTLALLYFFAWKYRESNHKATYHPQARISRFWVMSMWVIPAIFMLVLAFVMIPATHKLEPRKLIAADAKPITIKVIALRWKWLFLYPEQKIATVNFVQLPENTPVVFELTADEAPMSSFWIPNLGGQLYAMTGHVNELNLIADTPGDYPGSSAEINGAGFAGMKFTARVGSTKSFMNWVDRVKQSQEVLDTLAYEDLMAPSKNNQTVFYANYEADLYDKVISKYMGSHGSQSAEDETGHEVGH